MGNFLLSPKIHGIFKRDNGSNFVICLELPDGENGSGTAGYVEKLYGMSIIEEGRQEMTCCISYSTRQ